MEPFKIKGGAINVPRKSNILVGTVTSSAPLEKGVELLNSIQIKISKKKLSNALKKAISNSFLN